MKRTACFRLEIDSVLTPLEAQAKKLRRSRASIVEEALIEFMEPKIAPKYYFELEGPFTPDQLIAHLRDFEGVAIRTEDEYKAWLKKAITP
jgi:hypothetical protein